MDGSQLVAKIGHEVYYPLYHRLPLRQTHQLHWTQIYHDKVKVYFGGFRFRVEVTGCRSDRLECGQILCRLTNGLWCQRRWKNNK
jgi:hypothetical protein